jgi:UDP-GlcNAc:undecaprenyl-phosphate GlcNAc-1-phosphate transferase
MTVLPVLFCAALGMLVTWVAIPVIRTRLHFLKRGDLAQFHHGHGAPVSRLGGLALVLSFMIVSLIAFFLLPNEGVDNHFRWIIFFCSLAMFLLGFSDDLHPLGAKRKLAGQILIASIASYCGIQVQSVTNPFNHTLYHLGFLGPFLTILWLVALTNLINLIDGIDGLAGGVALMLMGLLCYFGFGSNMAFSSLCAAGMVGALIGFLRFNFPPAKIYMGDGGAYFLGFLIASLATVNSHKGTVMTALIAPVFVLALPITDVTIAILRRGLKGLPLFRADRKHIHHRLIDYGFSRTRAVLTLYFICLVFLLLALFVFWLGGRWVPALFGVGCAILLISARSFSFSREWFSVGRMLGNSLEARKTTQYALTLSRWLEMEADRCDSVESLWSDFKFMAKKLGFSRIKLVLEDGEKEWKMQNLFHPAASVHYRQVKLVVDRPMVLEFAADSEVMSHGLFDHLCDLTSEAWHKAALRWCAINRLPIRFNSRTMPQVLPLHKQRIYVSQAS